MTSGRAPRADAVRNRQRVLDTAEEVFAERGADAALLEIAARAGVGAGTVYRHFPTKEALYGAVVSARIGGLLDTVPSLPDEPPGTRLFAFWRLAVEQARANTALCEAVAGTSGALEVDDDVRARYRRTVGDLVDAAHRAGLLRPGLTASDVVALLSAAAFVETREHDAAPGRLAEIIGDALGSHEY
jgi:AcrR family transcriptional regulator